jgi:hypothetical protein
MSKEIHPNGDDDGAIPATKSGPASPALVILYLIILVWAVAGWVRR